MNKEPKQIRTEIVINASPAIVWSILTNFKQYDQWNPFIRKIDGVAKQGAKVIALIEPPGASAMTFRPRLQVVDTAKELRWTGNLIIPGLFDGEHIFELYENTNGTTTFVHREIFRGILVPLFKKMLNVSTLQGFENMNRSLKERAEGMV